MISNVRIELAAAYRLAVRHDLCEGINNHFTARAGKDRFLVLPHGLHWSEVTASRLLLVDGQGSVHAGEGEVEPSALYIHSRILRARPEAGAVLHTHQTYATAIASLDKGRLLPVSQNALRFHERIAYDDSYQGAADHAAEGERLASMLGTKDVLFHSNHGVIVVGPSVAKAYDDLYFLERAAKVQILAQATGKTLRFVADDVARAYVRPDRPNNLDKQAEEHFAALKRVLDRDEPDYAS
ncbi:MAG TPA: class II aldolase/adducin family protein [Vicinamibacteria bacterium]|nr:class II aldolase/adducin family protein [Vicinamibacteria bacterium]